jgi:cold shock CspA family protein/ribosome-associated translation inhibitor RaiA
MKVPLEITYRGVEKRDDIDGLIREKAASLDRISDSVTSCRVAVETDQQHQRAGRPYRVRITVNVPPGHEFAVRRESSEGSIHDELTSVIRSAFDAARRKVKKITEKRRGDVKTHAVEEEAVGIVVRLFHEEGYGFLKTLDGREMYFHKNAVLQNDFDRLEIGTAIRFEEEEGEEGPQSSTVQIVDKPGARVARGQSPLEPPLGWGQ